jgi:hypothetical protein
MTAHHPERTPNMDTKRQISSTRLAPDGLLHERAAIVIKTLAWRDASDELSAFRGTPAPLFVRSALRETSPWHVLSRGSGGRRPRGG